jgi:hypothetical protein
MDDTYLRRAANFVNREPKTGLAASERDCRRPLIAEAINRHGAVGVAALLQLLEADFGDDLRLDARLEHLIDADPRALARLVGTVGAR